MSAGALSCPKESSVDFANEHPVVLALWCLTPAAIIIVGLLADRRRRRVHASGSSEESAPTTTSRPQPTSAFPVELPDRDWSSPNTGGSLGFDTNFGSSDTGGDFSGGGGGERRADCRPGSFLRKLSPFQNPATPRVRASHPRRPHSDR